MHTVTRNQHYQRGIFQRIMVRLHLRSQCCYVHLVYRFGWSWKHDGWYCDACGESA